MLKNTENFFETKLPDLNVVIDNYILTMEASIRKTNSWTEVYPKRRARCLGSKYGFNLGKGYSNLVEDFSK